jgi:hypothetical protein
MKLHSRLLFLLIITSTAALTSCGGNGTPYSYQNITISVSPHITSIPVGTTMTFTATVTNAPDTINWFLSSFAYANVGSPTSQTTIGSTFVYTAPPTPPIYTGAGAFVNTQGTVTLEATFPDLGMNINDTQTFVVTAPSVTVGLSPATASVALNAAQQLTGYAVGSLNNALTPQVNGVTGGSTATGTIVPTLNQPPGTYTYTAPAAIPMTGDTVTVTIISQADPTKTASSIITLH